LVSRSRAAGLGVFTWCKVASGRSRILDSVVPGERPADDVNEKVKEKKRIYHAFSATKQQTIDVNAKKRRGQLRWLSVAKTFHYDDGNEKLEKRDDERHLYRLYKARYCQIEDIGKFFDINDENDHLRLNRKMAMERWHDYSERISTI
uniref:Uncharacterized protein n=1 Tax=Heligmosomoides polygyrus TaxID=6339 RepID=A0A183GQI1_HELPZ